MKSGFGVCAAFCLGLHLSSACVAETPRRSLGKPREKALDGTQKNEQTAKNSATNGSADGGPGTKPAAADTPPNIAFQYGTTLYTVIPVE